MSVQERSVSCAHSVEVGKVCSHAVTPAMLKSWGFDVEFVFDHLRIPGERFNRAKHAAWQAELVRLCTLDPRQNPVVPWRQSDESRAENFAWARSVLRPVDRLAV